MLAICAATAATGLAAIGIGAATGACIGLTIDFAMFTGVKLKDAYDNGALKNKVGKIEQ